MCLSYRLPLQLLSVTRIGLGVCLALKISAGYHIKGIKVLGYNIKGQGCLVMLGYNIKGVRVLGYNIKGQGCLVMLDYNIKGARVLGYNIKGQ